MFHFPANSSDSSQEHTKSTWVGQVAILDTAEMEAEEAWACDSAARCLPSTQEALV